MSAARVIPIFSAAFALIYVVAVEANLAAVTYFPQTGEWQLWAQTKGAGPAMHWYGWLITSFAGAAVVGAVALPLTRDREPPAWIGWAVPLAVMVAFLYFLRIFFIY